MLRKLGLVSIDELELAVTLIDTQHAEITRLQQRLAVLEAELARIIPLAQAGLQQEKLDRLGAAVQRLYDEVKDAA